MTKKSVGYVQLEWTCPRCSTRNPGPQKFCNGCGGPQPADVRFSQAPEEKLLTDAAEIARAKAGPDIHCPYCGARNLGTAKFCGACGGRLEGGQVRHAGQVVGAHRTGPGLPVKCPACGTENPAGAGRCRNCGGSLEAGAAVAPPPSPAAKPSPVRSRGLLVAGGILAVVCCLAAGVFVLLNRATSSASAVVQDVSWTRSVQVLSLGLVERDGWSDSLPSGAQVISCRYEYRGTQDQPGLVSTEVCGTPYTVDTGGGYGEVVQDCVYDVYDDWCEYTVEDWQVVDSISASGTDLNPYWPSVNLAGDQRQGESQEQYTVVLASADGQYEYQPSSEAEFSQFSIGSTWELEIDAFGNLSSVNPAD